MFANGTIISCGFVFLKTEIYKMLANEVNCLILKFWEGCFLTYSYM